MCARAGTSLRKVVQRRHEELQPLQQRALLRTAQQASTISTLEKTVSQLAAASEVQDKVNMQRDILANTARLDDIDDDANDLWEETEMIWEDLGGMADHMMQIIKLQSRIAILEKTVEFTRKDAM